MRYDARINEDDTWRVLDLQQLRAVIYHCTHAEANIIVFALNAIAERKTLAGYVKGEPDTWALYSGPTDEVAPNPTPAR